MKKALLLVLTSILFFSCGKTGSVVPATLVNITILKTDPNYTALSVAGGHVYLKGGVAGIIVYKRFNGTYAAYDRCSSYQPEKLCAVVADDNIFNATDPCSGSKFSLEDGSPVKGPANQYLRSYRAGETQYGINISN